MKPITVYWSPHSFDSKINTYSLEDFNDPVPIAKHSFHSQVNDSYFWQCPSIRDVTRNVFAFTSKYNEHTDLDQTQIQKFYKDNNLTRQGLEPPFITNDLPVSLTCARTNSLQKHINVMYGRSWIFFSDEPVEAKFTAPYLPPTSPTPGAMMVPGTFNIGKWFRDFHVEYFVPITATSWTYKKDDPFFYIEILTDRKVEFKKFDIEKSQKLLDIDSECVLTSVHFDKPYGLPKRYEKFKSLNHRKTILKEIRNITE